MLVFQGHFCVGGLVHAAGDSPHFQFSVDDAALVHAPILVFIDSKQVVVAFFAADLEVHELDIGFDYSKFVVISKDAGIGQG